MRLYQKNLNFTVLTCFLILFINVDSWAQDKPRLRHNQFQVGISPGIDNTNQNILLSSNFSFHLISGLTASIHGLQISLLTNYTLYDVKGLQLSLVSNQIGISKKHSAYDIKAFQGVQLSSVINKVDGNSVGIQASSINITNGYFSGFQFGLINTLQRTASGIQIGGFLNLAYSKNSLFQLGFINYSKEAGNNYQNTSYLFRDHCQIGLFNLSEKNYGFQIGLFNLSKNNNGVPIGLLNTNTSNFIAILAANELTNTYLTIGTGSRYIVNRLSLGYNYAWNNEVDWSFGYGLEAQFYRTYTIPVFSVYHDIIYYNNSSTGLFDSGYFVSKFGISYAQDYIDSRPLKTI
ncbi:LA_2272 family surface repeat-containing protein [Marivirga sp.]|uniref:LA_2272 family surface repeat-containing protein n=1 Tax=Marivirga sp. TaxID=2018662 RepID=UPI002D7EC6C8|nr:hypothetical protein [Marivirga sp.]HET8860528.1 hypothetical protein [Marivirga sp.]